ncbi:BspA family leucine-rich repeat surface protein [Mycoplasma feriruminatoris]|uniref:PARCEL domain protein n=1 Tax=Mycoplasma feriruminatoris TaxID=1179777 RepID=A0A654IPJ3_9MOLU|nr:hypothetical protein MF5583_00402 [Mycoplasma feriruminatoris]
MKKLLAILTSTSAVFLITVGIVLVNKQNNDNLRINYNIITQTRHEFADAGRTKLTKIGYYKWGNHYRIHQIPPTVTVIAAELPPQITSLRAAFVGAGHDIKWEKKWDTKNVTDMHRMFHNRIWFNNSEVLNWDTSNVTDMEQMFSGATSFNQDISGWNVSKVKNFKEMFKGATEFKHNLEKWNVTTNANNSNFGLKPDQQPKWKIEVVKPTEPIIKNETPLRSDDNRVDNSAYNIKPEIKDVPLTTPIKPTEPKETTSTTRQNINLENETIEKPNNSSPKEIESLNNTDTIPYLKNNSNTPTYPKQNILTIPSAKTGLKGRSNSNTKAIVGSVLGTTTILGAGTGAGFGYYYRKNLKDLFLKLKKRWFKSKLD